MTKNHKRMFEQMEKRKGAFEALGKVGMKFMGANKNQAQTKTQTMKRDNAGAVAKMAETTGNKSCQGRRCGTTRVRGGW